MSKTTWHIRVLVRHCDHDGPATRLNHELVELGLSTVQCNSSEHGFLISGDISELDADRIARELLVDDVVESYSIGESSDISESTTATILFKPGVMDPVAMSCMRAIEDLNCHTTDVRTYRRFQFSQPNGEKQQLEKTLANDAIEYVVWGPIDASQLSEGADYQFHLVTTPIRAMDDSQLEELSRSGMLSLSIEEMKTIQTYYRELNRDATDVELETIAQTWSEHCSHKTLKGRIAYEEKSQDGSVTRQVNFENMLMETIAHATNEIRKSLGEEDWCVSVFEDNAGIIRFDGDADICFKVETHNHPSAIEPYGGANTGIGGVIRDILGTGLGARPIANTDVFCFTRPDFPTDQLPAGVLHPRRVIKGVVSGVRDYGNRMGIPTVNGAVYFDDRYLGNPLVYCGTVGIIPHEFSHKETQPGDYIVALGGRTGRDGIHGATFSSIELTEESEVVSGGAVQIGNAITEKMVMDVLLEARDRRLFTAVTDCGAGGFSSAVGEMGEKIGAEVWLDQAPLKYQGLSYTEIWISEAQERMVLSVPKEHWDELKTLCESEDVEATIIGKFEPTGRLVLKYCESKVADISMNFLHDGRPPIIRKAVYVVPAETPTTPTIKGGSAADTLKSILGSLNVCSKEWVIRQYDHEVQAGSVIKPLVGLTSDGPSDAAVVKPIADSQRGVAISCGANPHFGDLDPYWMAASAIDEALRNCVAVGADPDRIAILDNFCWGNTGRAEELGTLVRASLACRDIAIDMGVPFVSGKDSLNNEFKGRNPHDGSELRIVIPATLLISAMGVVPDTQKCVTMDWKHPGNSLYLLGTTQSELGGSHYCVVNGLKGGRVPRVDTKVARATFRQLHQAIQNTLVRSCHDLSEGGLAVSIAEMGFSGGMGCDISLTSIQKTSDLDFLEVLFSESNSRFVVEVAKQDEDRFVAMMTGTPVTHLGHTTDGPNLRIVGTDRSGVEIELVENLEDLKNSWQSPLNWN